jgi:hypothetical protein
MTIELAGADPWSSIGGSMGGAAGDVMKSAGIASMASMMVPGAGWVQLGLQLLGGMMQGDTSQAGAGSGGESQLNTSGWVVGEGDAAGGGSSSSNSGAWPWYVWAALTVGAVVLIRRAG